MTKENFVDPFAFPQPEPEKATDPAGWPVDLRIRQYPIPAVPTRTGAA
jgi:hypothetical protein